MLVDCEDKLFSRFFLVNTQLLQVQANSYAKLGLNKQYPTFFHNKAIRQPTIRQVIAQILRFREPHKHSSLNRTHSQSTQSLFSKQQIHHPQKNIAFLHYSRFCWTPLARKDKEIKMRAQEVGEGCGYLYNKIIFLEGRIAEMEREQPNSPRKSEKLLQKSDRDEPMMMDGSRPLSQHMQSQINSGKASLLYKGQSLECSKEELIVFDKFIRCKSEDKPKDTLAWLSLKRQQFQNYVHLSPRPQRSNHSTSIHLEKIHHNIPMRRYYQCTIERHVGQGTALVLRIIMSQPAKCNVVVYDAEGRVLKYYPNCMVIKKLEKIIKIAEEYTNHPLLILDYAFQETHHKFFHSLYRKPRLILYHILNSTPKELELCLSELAGLRAAEKIDFQVMSRTISVFPAHVKQSNYQELIHLKDKFISGLEQEENFLQVFRGSKSQQDRNLDYDLLGVHLWKCSKAEPRHIVHKIIKLYKMKEETIIEQSSIPLPDPNALHIPHKMKKEQNCVLCLSKFPNLKSRRTSFVCKVCSAEKEKPFYLCKKCFGEYHLHPDIHIFKKNQKKTKKILRDHRKKNRQNLADPIQSNIKLENEEEESAQVRKKERLSLFNQLEKMTEEVFGRIDDLLEDGEKNVASCQFYLSMMLNNNIMMINMLEAKNRPNPQSDRQT